MSYNAHLENIAHTSNFKIFLENLCNFWNAGDSFICLNCWRTAAVALNCCFDSLCKFQIIEINTARVIVLFLTWAIPLLLLLLQFLLLLIIQSLFVILRPVCSPLLHGLYIFILTRKPYQQITSIGCFIKWKTIQLRMHIHKLLHSQYIQARNGIHQLRQKYRNIPRNLVSSYLAKELLLHTKHESI